MASFIGRENVYPCHLFHIQHRSCEKHSTVKVTLVNIIPLIYVSFVWKKDWCTPYIKGQGEKLLPLLSVKSHIQGIWNWIRRKQLSYYLIKFFLLFSSKIRKTMKFVEQSKIEYNAMIVLRNIFYQSCRSVNNICLRQHKTKMENHWSLPYQCNPSVTSKFTDNMV